MGWELGPDWTELTQECLLDIFSRLSLEERWNGPMFVCKTWMNGCQDPSLNLVFDLETKFQSLPGSVSCWWSPEFGDKIDSVLRSVVDWSKGGLKEVRVRHCTDSSISYVAERCPNLEVLSVKYCPKVTDDSMLKIALMCPKLKELDISFSYKISCVCVDMIGKSCKNIQTFKRNLIDPAKVTRSVPSNYLEDPSIFLIYGNIDAYVIGKHMHQLKHLELRFSTLSDNGLAQLCEGCLNLEYLDLFGCSKLTSDGVTNSISNLKHLKEIKKPIFPAFII
ncbi:putative F-box/LRR-repeat protein 19 [Raphanus sativus]|uniref:F-box/LRR-repeat protein 19 n=1 Tax=Raphanus sativus TaxID=3726 RepID=A0A6J0NBY8_RAPSA|nr:putative F-box/LRR-repeat protein 19 [Raphanus sativus]KAJ4899050.1 putative F-box/LRR-repeat protein 19 [Raphanus sativus]